MGSKRSGLVPAFRRVPQQERSRFLVGVLLEATERSMASRGFARASVRGIAQAAGIGIGSLYQYFDGKHSLVRTLIDRRLAQDLEEVRLLLREACHRPLEDVIREGIELLVPDQAWKKNAMVAMVDALEELDRNGKMRATLESLVTLLEVFLREHPELNLEETTQKSRMIVFGVRAAALEEMRVKRDWVPERVREDLVLMTKGVLDVPGPTIRP